MEQTDSYVIYFAWIFIASSIKKKKKPFLLLAIENFFQVSKFYLKYLLLMYYTYVRS